ncbi:MAG: hypothetical protein ACRCX8_10375 [Sarcina sp.]
MINKDVIQEIWTMLQKGKLNMSLVERCKLQKLLKRALEYDLNSSDREDFIYHKDTFEDDMMMISSKVQNGILEEIVAIQSRLNKIERISNGGENEER